LTTVLTTVGTGARLCVPDSEGIAVDDSGAYVISGGSTVDQNGYMVL
jgi:hypothetical protein